MRGFSKKHKILLTFAIILVVWAAFFLLVDTEVLVKKIGVENTYIVAFLLAVFGGLSSITGSSFFVAVATFAGNGANPLLLGLWGGLGIFISDSIFFFIARYGVKALKEESKETAIWIKNKMEKLPLWGVLVGIYLYVAFTPLPNDLLMIALALYGITYKRIILALMAGSITVVTLVAYLGEGIFEFF